jgi:RNA polymerase sigma factor (TIGR02999 family)
MKDVTRILTDVGRGDVAAAEKLLPLVYDELRRLAAQRMSNELPGQTLQPTALVHEAYLRLVDVEEAQQWNGRGHFFAAAAEAMRRILIDRARRKQSLKAGGDRQKLELPDVEDSCAAKQIDLLALDEALAELERHDPQSAQLVKLRFFIGLSHQDAADALGIGRRTADRLWLLARAWLYQRIGNEQ